MSIHSKEAAGWKFLLLALIAFSGLGLEIVIGIIIEPLIYGVDMPSWNVSQNVSHWCITCIVWGVISFLLICWSKRSLYYSVLKRNGKVKLLQWVLILLCILVMLVISYYDWNGFKIVKEFRYNGLTQFIFQYIYYVFETVLFSLIIVFGQRAGEKWFGQKNIPYGGILVAVTWGLVHILTQGSISAGLITALGGLVYGIIYLLADQDIKKAFPFILVCFIL